MTAIYAFKYGYGEGVQVGKIGWGLDLQTETGSSVGGGGFVGGGGSGVSVGGGGSGVFVGAEIVSVAPGSGVADGSSVVPGVLVGPGGPEESSFGVGVRVKKTNHVGVAVKLMLVGVGFEPKAFMIAMISP